jgi:integrase/recombinase XerD
MRLYRRHTPKCRHYGTEDAFDKNNCRCPIYADSGSRGKGARTSLKTRDWTRAESRLRKLQDAEDGGTPVVKIATACKAFMGDCERRNLKPPTIRSYEKTLQHFQDFCEKAEVSLIAEATPAILLQFQNGREVPPAEEGEKAKPLEPSTVRKELQTLRAFFRFLVDQGHADHNNAKKLRPPKESRRPTMPFSQPDVEALLAAAGGMDNDDPAMRDRTRKRARAIVLTMLYSGLRISDITTLERKRVDLKTGMLLLRMEKTNEPVYVRLLAPAIGALSALPREGPFFFWSGESAPATAIGNIRRTVERICKNAGVIGHPHRFRDTFAVRMLEKGVSIDQVSILLGHTSVKTTEKYYAPWVRARQHLLDAAVETLDFVTPQNIRLQRIK